MLGKISTLKDEIMQKETAIVAEQDKGTKQDKFNKDLEKDITKITNNITSSNKMIQT